MSHFGNQLSGVSKSKYAVGGLYLLLIGLAASDIIPTPADAAFFYQSKKLRDQYFNGEITPTEYWEKSAFAYYFYNFVFWILIGIIIVSIKGDFNTKAKWLIGLIGAGAVVAVLYKNIKKDELTQSLAKEALIPKT